MAKRRIPSASDPIETAMLAFWSRGYASTSVQDIVDLSGANRAALYADYRDKRSLFIAALERYADMLRSGLIGGMKDDHSPLEVIRRFFLNFSQDACDGCNRGCFINNAALEVAPHDEEIHAIVEEMHRDVEKFFAKMIDRAKADGSASPALDTKTAARGLLASAIGLTVLARTRPEPRLLNCIVDDAVSRLR